VDVYGPGGYSLVAKQSTGSRKAALHIQYQPKSVTIG